MCGCVDVLCVCVCVRVRRQQRHKIQMYIRFDGTVRLVVHKVKRVYMRTARETVFFPLLHLVDSCGVLLFCFIFCFGFRFPALFGEYEGKCDLVSCKWWSVYRFSFFRLFNKHLVRGKSHNCMAHTLWMCCCNFLQSEMAQQNIYDHVMHLRCVCERLLTHSRGELLCMRVDSVSVRAWDACFAAYVINDISATNGDHRLFTLDWRSKFFSLFLSLSHAHTHTHALAALFFSCT